MNDFESLNPCKFEFSGKNRIYLTAIPNTDFMCKFNLFEKDSASLFYKEISGDFTVSSKLSVLGENFGDATILMVRESHNRWIKLCIELGPDGRCSVVSVITDGWSDDANGELLPSNEAWVRITRKGNFFGLHYSLDGMNWRFVRAFGLKLEKKIKVGYGIQAPRSLNCTGTVDDFKISDKIIKDFRNGE